MIREQAQDARMYLGAITKEQAEVNKRASLLYNDILTDPEAADLLIKTWEIIKSDTGYSASLAASIRSFYHAMKTEARLNGIEAQIQEMQESLKKSRAREKEDEKAGDDNDTTAAGGGF